MKEPQSITIPDERIIGKIFLIRGRKVMFDKDIAELYDVTTGVLNQAVKRNQKRFPEDFMFQLTMAETKIWQGYILRSQFVTSKNKISRSQIVILKHGKNIKYAPFVFTEQGVAMLSSVLKSERAIAVNIQIIRTFTKLREMLTSHKDLREKIEQMEKKYDKQLKAIFEALKRLLVEEVKPKTEIGFKQNKK